MFQAVLCVYSFPQNRIKQSAARIFLFTVASLLPVAVLFLQETSLSTFSVVNVSFVLTLSIFVQFCLLRLSNATD